MQIKAWLRLGAAGFVLSVIALGLAIWTVTTRVTPLSQGGTGETTTAAARAALGAVGTNDVIALANGGTGASTAETARTALELGALAVKDSITIAEVDDIADLSVATTATTTTTTMRGGVNVDSESYTNGYIFPYGFTGSVTTLIAAGYSNYDDTLFVPAGTVISNLKVTWRPGATNATMELVIHVGTTLNQLGGNSNLAATEVKATSENSGDGFDLTIQHFDSGALTHTVTEDAYLGLFMNANPTVGAYLNFQYDVVFPVAS